MNDSIVIHETPQDFQGFKCGSVFAGAIDDTLQVIQFDVNTWKICGEIVDRVTKIAIRLMRESYGQCMKENIIELLKYLKFELETVNENT